MRNADVQICRNTESRKCRCFCISAFLISASLLSACAESPKRDYESSAACAARGIKADSPDFENCVREERTERMLKAQREEYEQRKRDEEDWRLRRY